jgi:capsular exopolysaccharide synthesis family protein
MDVSNDQKTGGPATIGEQPGLLPADMLKYFKGLAGHIEIGLPQAGCRAVLLSSALAGEGTTEVTIGLALALAGSMGKRTAIVDCNMHHPEVHARFGVPQVGLGEYLGREIPLEKALFNTVVPNLYVMPVGKRPLSLAAFSQEDFSGLVADLRKRFDYVLMDAAPVGAHPECAVLCDKVDSVILVVKHGSTRREVVVRAKEIIIRAGGRILGIVLNRRKFPIPEFLYKRL